MKAVLKYFFVTLLVGFSSLSFSQNKAKTVTLDGVVVDLNEISEDKPFKTLVDKKDGFKKAYSGDSLKNKYEGTEIAIFTNKGENSFIKVNSELFIYNRESNDIGYNTSFAFYNSSGTKLWEKNNNEDVYSSKIDSKGKFIFIKSISPSTYIDKLNVFNRDGQLLFEDKEIINLSYSHTLNSVCYEKEESDVFSLHFFNAESNLKWSKKLAKSERVSEFLISPQGKNIAACYENFLHVWNSEGIEIWKKHFKKYSGLIYFSKDEKYLIWNKTYSNEGVEVYDSNFGNIVYSYGTNNSKIPISIDYTTFIEDLNINAFVRFIKNNSTEVTLISIEGKLLDKVLIDKRFNSSYNITIDKDTLYIYFDNILVLRKVLNS